MLTTFEQPSDRRAPGTVVVPALAVRTVNALPVTTDLAPLRGKRVLCLLDDDNLRISLRAHGVALAHRSLLAHLRGVAREVTAWIVFTAPEGAENRTRLLSSMGWNVLRVTREYVVQGEAVTAKCNADHDLCFVAGRVAAAGAFDTVLVGTGDGDLAVSLARSFAAFTSAHVVSLSVPGSSSHRLRDGSLFGARVFVGHDLTYHIPTPAHRDAPGTLSAAR